MRPLRLTLQAFGPYAGKEVIDFTKLGNRTMFVITGKTGAGKTTIYDGICFAIYGKASGEDRSGTDLRSHFADPEILTEVSLLFSLRGQTYYIVRSPQQEKKKARGDGMTTVNGKAELYRITDQGEKQIIASNVRETDEKIKELIQLDANQFRQILMIPQGEFRKLLVSDSKEKEAILQKLFHTELYKKIEEKLKEEADQLKSNVQQRKQEQERLLKSIRAHSRKLLEALHQETLDPQRILELLSSELKEWRSRYTLIESEISEKQVQRDELKEQMTQGKAILDQFTLKRQLEEEKTQLERQKGEVEKQQLEVERAKKAAKLDQQENQCRRLHAEIQELEKRNQTFQNQLSELEPQLIAAEKNWEEEQGKEEERKNAVEAISRLKALENDIQSYEEETKALEKMMVQWKERQQEKQTYTDQLKKIEESLEQKNSLLSELEQTKILLLQRERLIEKTERIVNRLLKYQDEQNREERTLSALAAAEKQLQAAERAFLDAKATVQHLEKEWRDGQAGILAQSLQEQEPCPVCGSIHHPDPAQYKHELPSEEDLNSAKKQAAQVEKRKQEAERKTFQLQLELKTIENSKEEIRKELESLFPNFSEESLSADIKEQQSSLQELKQRKRQDEKALLKEQELKTEVEQLDVQKQQVENALEKCLETVDEIEKQMMMKRANIERMNAQIPENLRSKSSFQKALQERIEYQESLQKSYDDAQKRYQELKMKMVKLHSHVEEVTNTLFEKKKQMDLERNTFKQMLKEEGFPDYQHYEEAKRTEQDIKVLEKAIQDFWERYRYVSSRMDELERVLEGIHIPDLDRLNQKLNEIMEELAQLDEKRTSTLLTIQNNEMIYQNVTEINQEMEQLEEQYKTFGHLYEITKGQNPHRLTFERYVLAAFLDDILLSANERLAKMTGGRYRMLRKRVRSKGNVQSGLELLIYDQYTGQTRHVKTLSGGESFKASLSLALGMADVVQSYAGGISLETMFIDEGFGTLDPESLDQAIEALMDIQDSGRLVGIISHVPELKERIDARLEVVSTQNGSHTKFHIFY
ncbi:MAG: SMC family ATPase [Bacillales bacterium]|nr:SMC family ATPase [Bacillales bacterium]